MAEERIVVGLWDCSYCGSKRIRGTEKKCPHCGAPKGHVKHYMGEYKEYLPPKEASEYGKGANWICPYCGSQNRYYSEKCESCGSEKKAATEDYFGNNPNKNSESSSNTEKHSDSYFSHSEVENREKEKRKTKNLNSTNNEFHSPVKSSNNFFSNFKLLISGMIGLGIFVGLIMLLVMVFTPKTYDAVVSSNSWSKSVSIDQYKTVKENDWSIPSGGRVYKECLEIHHYDKVIDHYETISEQKSREVVDHYETETSYSYSDNGDGTFTEHSNNESVPVYKTEYYTVEHSKPVYKDVPVYETKYYYEIDKWVYDRTEKSAGKNDKKPYWPKYTLAENEKVSGKNEKFSVVFSTQKKDYNYSVSESDWTKLKVGTKVKITVQAGIVTNVESLNHPVSKTIETE